MLLGHSLGQEKIVAWVIDSDKTSIKNAAAIISALMWDFKLQIHELLSIKTYFM